MKRTVQSNKVMKALGANQLDCCLLSLLFKAIILSKILKFFTNFPCFFSKTVQGFKLNY